MRLRNIGSNTTKLRKNVSYIFYKNRMRAFQKIFIFRDFRSEKPQFTSRFCVKTLKYRIFNFQKITLLREDPKK